MQDKHAVPVMQLVDQEGVEITSHLTEAPVDVSSDPQSTAMYRWCPARAPTPCQAT